MAYPRVKISKATAERIVGERGFYLPRMGREIKIGEDRYGQSIYLTNISGKFHLWGAAIAEDIKIAAGLKNFKKISSYPEDWKGNPGRGKAFTFHGSFQSLILARRKERETPGSFIHKSGDRYYVLKPKKISTPRKNVKRLSRQNPAKGVLIYGKVLKIFAEKTSGPFKGQRFVHKFKPGAILMGMPDGSLRISHPK